MGILGQYAWGGPWEAIFLIISLHDSDAQRRKTLLLDCWSWKTNNNGMILKGGLGILSMLTDRCTFIKIGSKNWDSLSKTSPVCNVWKSIWTCGTLMSRKQGWHSRRSWLRSIRSELGNLLLNTAGINIPLNWAVEHHCTTDPLWSELSFHHWTFLLCLTSGCKASAVLKFGHVWHGGCLNGMGQNRNRRCIGAWTGEQVCGCVVS